MATLKEITPGTRVRVVRLKDCGLKTRLLSMGMTKGTEIEVLRKAPLGGPIAITLREYTLCLRRNDADKIEVEAV